jgi:hypothetical protein
MGRCSPKWVISVGCEVVLDRQVALSLPDCTAREVGFVQCCFALFHDQAALDLILLNHAYKMAATRLKFISTVIVELKII